jgi:hypothetical protein
MEQWLSLWGLSSAAVADLWTLVGIALQCMLPFVLILAPASMRCANGQWKIVVGLGICAWACLFGVMLPTASYGLWLGLENWKNPTPLPLHMVGFVFLLFVVVVSWVFLPIFVYRKVRQELDCSAARARGVSFLSVVSLLLSIAIWLPSYTG